MKVRKMIILSTFVLLACVKGFSQDCIDWEVKIDTSAGTKSSISKTDTSIGTETKAGVTITFKKAQCSQQKKVDKATRDWNKNKDGVKTLYRNSFATYLYVKV